MVPKKVSEPVPKKIGTEKSLGTGLGKIRYQKKSRNRSRKNLVPKKISKPVLKFFRLFVLIWVLVSSRSRDFCTFLDGIGTGLEKIWYRKKSRNRSRKKMSTEKSLGIGLEKFWYRKKSWNRSRKNLVPKKILGIGLVQILGLVTHWKKRHVTDEGSQKALVKKRHVTDGGSQMTF